MDATTRVWEIRSDIALRYGPRVLFTSRYAFYCFEIMVEFYPEASFSIRSYVVPSAIVGGWS
jgi:hypothetical protein